MHIMKHQTWIFIQDENRVTDSPKGIFEPCSSQQKITKNRADDHKSSARLPLTPNNVSFFR